MNASIAFFHVFRQKDRSLSQRRAAEEERRMAVEEALDELLASDTHYRRELDVQIASRIAVAEGKRRARTLELKEVRRQFRWNDSRMRSASKAQPKGLFESRQSSCVQEWSRSCNLRVEMWESLKLWKDRKEPNKFPL